MNLILEDWLEEQDLGPGAAGTSGGDIPMNTSGSPNIGNVSMQMGTPPPQQVPEAPPPDVSSDPSVPDMPDEDEVNDKKKDFETWKKEFLIESVKSDIDKMKTMLLDVRDREMTSYQSKFIEDNLQIIFLRENANIDKATKEIRKLIKSELDRNNPATSVVNHICNVLDQQPFLSNNFIKFTGLRAMKGEMHREFIAALLGAVQVSSGVNTEDIIYNEHEYSIRISTRFNSRFGDVHLGEWVLKEDDPERYLKQVELRRLEEGSPEERDVLRRRIVMESIAKAFEKRAFIINVVGTDGTIYTVGWDLASSLKTAYQEGNLIVRTKKESSGEAMIDDDGNIVPLMDLKIMFVQRGEQDEEGNTPKKLVEFMTRKYGQLFLSANLETLRNAASSFNGIVLKETPWQGNKSDLRVLARCVPSSPEILLRSCT